MKLREEAGPFSGVRLSFVSSLRSVLPPLSLNNSRREEAATKSETETASLAALGAEAGKANIKTF